MIVTIGLTLGFADDIRKDVKLERAVNRLSFRLRFDLDRQKIHEGQPDVGSCFPVQLLRSHSGLR